VPYVSNNAHLIPEDERAEDAGLTDEDAAVPVR